jgi:hypothetical protein
MEKKSGRNKSEKQEARQDRREDRQEARSDRKEERKSRQKKELDIDIDTKRVDISIDRDQEGNLDIEWDGKHVDGKYSKSKDGKVRLEVEINDDELYVFEGNGSNRRLPKGAIWKLTGSVIKGFLRRGWGKINK